MNQAEMFNHYNSNAAPDHEFDRRMKTYLHPSLCTQLPSKIWHSAIDIRSVSQDLSLLRQSVTSASMIHPRRNNSNNGTLSSNRLASNRINQLNGNRSMLRNQKVAPLAAVTNSNNNSSNMRRRDLINARLNRLNNMFNEYKDYGYPEPTPVLANYLFLGNCISSLDTYKLRKLGIRNILNVAAGDLDDGMPSDHQGMNVKKINMADEEETDILKHVLEAVRFLEEVRARGERVLVHCSHGQSRSPAIVIAYLMLIEKLALESCLHQLTVIRPCVSPNNGFLRQLMFLECISKQIEQQLAKPSTFHRNMVSDAILYHLSLPYLHEQFLSSPYAKGPNAVDNLYGVNGMSLRDREYLQSLITTYT